MAHVFSWYRVTERKREWFSLFLLAFWQNAKTVGIQEVDLWFNNFGLKIIYSRVNMISFGRDKVRLDHYWTHTNTLKIPSPLSISFLTSFIDLDQIQHLSLSSLDDILTYVPLEEIMPQLRELSIHIQVDIDTINRMGNQKYAFLVNIMNI
jgi:hypothetical protein